MQRDVSVESRRVLLDDVFQVEEAYVRYSLPDGRVSEPVRRLCFERGDSVAALLVHRQRRSCVLARQFRYPAYTRGEAWLAEIPAGIVEPGESPESAIRREILEEVGYEMPGLVSIGTVFPSPGGSSERIHIYFSLVGDDDQVSAGGGNPAEHEAIEVIEVGLADIDDMLVEGAVSDAKTVVALTWLQLRLERREVEVLDG